MGLYRSGVLGAAALLIFGAAAVSAQGAAGGEGCSSRMIGGSDESWRLLSPGLEFRRFRLRFKDGHSSRMNGVRIDQARFAIRLKWQAGRSVSAKAASEIARRERAAVATNAGYFDEKGRPLGYFRTNGKVYNSRLLFRGRRRALHLGAVFYVRGGRAGIATREDFDPEGVTEAFQAGPYLVRGGKPDSGLDAYREFRRADRRSVLALGKKRRLIFLVSEEIGRGISWCELQDFMSRSEAAGGLGAVEAMNLDGGSSSQLYVRGKGLPRNLEGRIVPALILAIPRGSRGGS